MYKVFSLAMLSISLLFVSNCNKKEEPWAESVARVIEIAEVAPNQWGIKIEYAVPESVAVNAQGEKIIGPITQTIHYAVRPTMEIGQELKVQYLKAEPITVKLEENMSEKLEENVPAPVDAPVEVPVEDKPVDTTPIEEAKPVVEENKPAS